jgi:hypothetical protein
VYGLKKKPDSRVQGKQLLIGVAHGKQFTKTSYTGLFQPCTTHKFPGKNPYQTNIRELLAPRPGPVSCAPTPHFPLLPPPFFRTSSRAVHPFVAQCSRMISGVRGHSVASHCPPNLPRQPCRHHARYRT